MIHDVDVVAVPEQAVLCLRDRGPMKDIGRRASRLRELASQAGLAPAGPVAARFYADEDGPEPDYDVCLPVAPSEDGSVPDRLGEARGELIPLHHVLQAAHVGPHDTMQDAWRAVREACAALGYVQSGPITEVYVNGRGSGVAPAGYVTLVRLPYAR
jgi:effector-binding domain-containing protein